MSYLSVDVFPIHPADRPYTLESAEICNARYEVWLAISAQARYQNLFEVDIHEYSAVILSGRRLNCKSL